MLVLLFILSSSVSAMEKPCRPRDPIQMVLVTDGKQPFYVSNKHNKRNSTPFYYALAQGDFVRELHFHFPLISIGATCFTDYPTSSQTKFYCYKFRGPLNNSPYFWSVYPHNPWPEVDEDGWDSALNALFFTALDKGIGWDKDPKAKKVLVLVSNNEWKHKEDAHQTGPEYALPLPTEESLEGDQCGFGPVSKETLINTLDKHNFHVIGLLTERIYDKYADFFGSRPNYAMLKLWGTNTAAGESVLDLILPVLRAWFCTCEVKYEFALAVDNTWTFVEKPEQKPESYLPSNLIELLSKYRLPKLIGRLTLENPTSLFHLTTFGDYPTVVNHNLDSHCYKYQLTTSDRRTFLHGIANVDRTYGGGDNEESSLTALLYTATDPNIPWSEDGVADKVVKIIAIATEQFFKSADDPGPTPEYKYEKAKSTTCCSCDFGPPYQTTVFEVLRKRGFFIIPMVKYDLHTIAVEKWNASLQNSVMKERFFWPERPNVLKPYYFDEVWGKVDEWAEGVCAGVT